MCLYRFFIPSAPNTIAIVVVIASSASFRVNRLSKRNGIPSYTITIGINFPFLAQSQSLSWSYSPLHRLFDVTVFEKIETDDYASDEEGENPLHHQHFCP
jgi:hypothetical protein